MTFGKSNIETSLWQCLLWMLLSNEEIVPEPFIVDSMLNCQQSTSDITWHGALSRGALMLMIFHTKKSTFFYSIISFMIVRFGWSWQRRDFNGNRRDGEELNVTHAQSQIWIPECQSTCNPHLLPPRYLFQQWGPEPCISGRSACTWPIFHD